MLDADGKEAAVGKHQVVVKKTGENDFEYLCLPAPRATMHGQMRWGRHDCLFTPAYWAAQAWLHSESLESAAGRLGSSLAEEIAVCILGGHGMPSEVGLAAFDRVRKAGLLDATETNPARFEQVLREPLVVGERRVRYRFVRQRSAFLADAMAKLEHIAASAHSPQLLRKRLLEVHGIGLKTASWIVRNWLGADDVAILDVHIHRAGLIAGFFSRSSNIARDYLAMEHDYLRFSDCLAVRASRLDSLIWNQMKLAGSLGIKMVAQTLRQSADADTIRAA